MALARFEKDMAIISTLDDEPNDVGGLTAAELKAKFDEGGQAIKQFLNETLTPQIDSEKLAVMNWKGLFWGRFRMEQSPLKDGPIVLYVHSEHSNPSNLQRRCLNGTAVRTGGRRHTGKAQ